MENTLTPLSPNDTFQFSCDKRLSCFNSCCSDLNQLLTPFDILQLKNHLGVSSTEFLARYTTRHTGPESGLPIITLKPAIPSGQKCTFVTSAGCSVYAGRPSSCRLYPLIRAISRSKKTGSVSEHFILLKEPHCRGFDQDKCQTVREWIVSQGLAMYNQMNDMLMEIISLKNLHMPGSLDKQSRHVFHMALYDLDSFKGKIINEGLRENLHLEPERLETIANDDVALLEIGHRWVKQMLFGMDGFKNQHSNHRSILKTRNVEH